MVRVLALTTGIFLLALPALGESRFVDDDDSRHEPFIEAAAAAGITEGCNPPHNDRFCPNRMLSRAELALMLWRAKGSPAGPDPAFVDVPDDESARVAIGALAAAGITRGCGLDRFCPHAAVTRAELATFLTRLIEVEPGHNLYPFRDLHQTSHGPALAYLGRRGQIEPCDLPTGQRMCPQQLVSRGEAVTALIRLLEVPVVTPADNPSGPRIAFRDAFDTLRLWGGRNPGARNRVVLAEDGFRGTGLRVEVPAGSHYGADFRLALDEIVDPEPTRLFFRYMLRLDSDWSPTWSGKLPGFSGVYGAAGKGGRPSTASTPGWSARVQFFGSRPEDERARLGYYVYHLGQERRYGDGMMWNDAGKLLPGEWYCIEGEVRLNTPGIADGALRAWVDGTPAFDVTGIEFRRVGEPDIRIESFWFNVYYGGKPVAERDMGLTIDEVAVDSTRVGCEVGDQLRRPVEGDLLGDGYPDLLMWARCPEGDCFVARTAHGAPRRFGNGAWFNLATHRSGFALGDFTGNGRDDLVYWGRCGSSKPCWRLHRSFGVVLGPGEHWGGGARFPDGTVRLIAGDWDGDGRHDLVYRGVCGTDRRLCWRAHLSSGAGFAPPADWGNSPDVEPQVADVTGDGRHDLVYVADCGTGECWWLQASHGDRFGAPVVLAPTGDGKGRWLDALGTGRAGLVTTEREGPVTVIRFHPVHSSRLGEPVVLARVEGAVAEVWEAASGEIVLLCDGPPCPERLRAWEGRLWEPHEYRRQLGWARVMAHPHRLE